MVSKSKKVLCLLLALLCMTTIFTDVLTPKAEAVDPLTLTAAGTATLAQALLYAGITAVSVYALCELANQYYAQAAPEVKQDVIDISCYINGDGNPSPNGNQKPELNIPGGAAGVTLLSKLSNVIKDIQNYFNKDEGTVDIADESVSYFGDIPIIERASQYSVEQMFDLAPYGVDDVVELANDGGITNIYSILKSGDEYWIKCNGSPVLGPVGLNSLFSDVTIKFGFLKLEDSPIINPFVVCRGTKSNRYSYSSRINADLRIDNGFFRLTTPLTSKLRHVSYTRFPNACDILEVERQLRAQEALEQAREQAGLEPLRTPTKIPFPYPWIIVEPDGDVVENPDKSDVPILPVPVTPSTPDTPVSPQPPSPSPTITPSPEPTPTPTATPTPLIPLFPDEDVYRDWLRRLWKEVGLNPDTIVAPPAPSTNSDLNPDTGTSPAPNMPVSPIDPSGDYVPPTGSIPDIGGTWDYVSDFLQDALIWMKLWFSGFLLLPQPIQTSLWALIVIGVVLGLLKVFLQ